MPGDTTSAESRAVAHLSFGKKTAKRVAWESWEFTVVGPHQVAVANASYGHLMEDHTYTVGVEDRDGLAVPAECGCPADKYREDYDCKHKVALATVGGPTVLNAALDFETPSPTEPTPATTMGDKLRGDGGVPGDAVDSGTEPCVNGDPKCGGMDGDDLPCFACYQTGD